jgi:hypothetical protein
MNVEIGAEAGQFPEKEYINGIAVAVRYSVIVLQFMAVALEQVNDLTKSCSVCTEFVME